MPLDINTPFTFNSLSGTVNQNHPPSTGQKNAMRSTWFSGQVTMQICRLICQESIKHVCFDIKMAEAALPAITGIDFDSITLPEYINYIILSEKMGNDTTQLRAALHWHDIPLSFDNTNGAVIYRRKAIESRGEEGELHSTTMNIQNQPDAMNLLINAHLYDQALFAVLYLSDVERLLFEDRDRGQSFPRYLPIYANRKINERLYHNFKGPADILRLRTLDGLQIEDVDYPMLMEVLKESRIAG